MIPVKKKMLRESHDKSCLPLETYACHGYIKLLSLLVLVCLKCSAIQQVLCLENIFSVKCFQLDIGPIENLQHVYQTILVVCYTTPSKWRHLISFHIFPWLFKK